MRSQPAVVGSEEPGLIDMIDGLSKAFEVWPRAQVVSNPPSWKGKPESAYLVEILASDPGRYEEKLAGNVNHPNQLVAAYCLVTLERIGSKALRSLPKELLERKDKVTVRTGSFSEKTELGALARQLQKRHSEDA